MDSSRFPIRSLAAIALFLAASAWAAEPLVVEIEASAATASAGATAVQPMAGFGRGWGGDAQLFWSAPAPAGDGPRLTVAFAVERAGSYELVLFHTVAPDYGRFTVLLDGRPSSDVDGYGPVVALSRSVLGRHQLAAGRHELAVRVTGKAAASTGYLVGLDRLEATPVELSEGRREPATMRLVTPPPITLPVPAAPPPLVLGRKAEPVYPTVHVVGYRPLRPYAKDYLCWLVPQTDGPIQAGSSPPTPAWKKGVPKSICSHSSGGLLEGFGDFLVNAIGQFVSSLGSLVDGLSVAYSTIKGGVVDVVAGAFAEIGCGDPCRLAVQLALDAALVSAGVPPSLPDFDQVVADLEQQGIDALSQTLAEAAVSQGLPAPLAEEAAKQAVEHLVGEAKKAAAGAGGGSAGGGASDWRPDPARAYLPGAFVVELRNPHGRATEELFLGLTQGPFEKKSAQVSVDAGGAWLWAPETIEVGGLKPAFRKVPSLAPGSSLQTELTLEPVPDPHRWVRLYNDAPAKVTERRNKLCGTSPPAGVCYGLDDTSEGCKKRRQWDECFSFWSEKFFELNSSALYLRDLFLELYGPGADSFELSLMPEKGKVRIATQQGVAFVTYPTPMWAGRRLDRCSSVKFGPIETHACGEAVARRWCQRMGYPQMTDFRDASGLFPAFTTATLDGQATCTGAHCAAFAEITCSTAPAVAG